MRFILNVGDQTLENETSLLKGMDYRERIIVMNLFLVQSNNPKGITWGDLLGLPAVSSKMSRQTFSHRLKDLLDRRVLEREVIENRRGKPTLYRINSKLFAGLRESRERYYPWNLEGRIESFEKDIASFETQSFVDAMMELAFGLLNMLAIALVGFCETEVVRWLFYEATYENIEQLFRNIVNRASRNKENKEETLGKLFEMLETFAGRSIGKRFGLNAFYSSKQDIIKAAIEKKSTCYPTSAR
jgi:DNA-binding transcriptional ArsR family regulator